jgi:hypothetical protein
VSTNFTTTADTHLLILPGTDLVSERDCFPDSLEFYTENFELFDKLARIF